MTHLKTLALSLSFGFGAMATAASAHHGWSSYDDDLNMVATVTKVKFGNPHDRLQVQDAEGGLWDILLAPPVRNRRYGYDETTVCVGQDIRLIGERHPSKNEAKIHQIWVGETMVYEYLYTQDQTSYDRLGKTPPENPTGK